MPKTLSPHAATARVLQHVIQNGMNLPAALNKIKSDKPAVTQAYSYDVIRYWFRLDFRVQLYLQKPFREKDTDLHCLLCLGCYLLEDESTPDHAAINETVNACKQLNKLWAKKLVNGILRNLQRNKDNDEAAITDCEVASYNHPAWLIQQIKSAWPEQAESILRANLQHAPMTLRVNQQRLARDDYLARLETENIDAEICLHSDAGIRLARACNVNDLPGFNEGQVSVQDEAAQHAAILLDPKPGEVVLDACAAPGGKTVHLLEVCPSMARLVAVDKDAERVQLINENINRVFSAAALPELELHSEDVATMMANSNTRFDAILLDAPCSATGVIRRHPDIRLLRRFSDIKQLVSEQARFLDAAWQALKPGGRLLYCTCSILPAENQQQIESFINRTNDASLAPFATTFNVKWGHAVTPGGRQILPGEDAQDGFYYCLLYKDSK